MTKKTKTRKWTRNIAFLMVCSLFLLMTPIHANEQANVMTATVMIDPGHGSIDSGAIAYNGQYEKDLTLEYALKIGADIQALDPTISVIYTRTDDTLQWVNENTTENFEWDDLMGRSNMVNQISPDYFLCLHFNSAEDPSAFGYEAFVRQEDTASQQVYSLMSRKFADLGYSYDLGLMSTANAPLHMVDLTDSASMLLELGFLSNEYDLSLINDPNMKDNLCMAIAQSYVETIHAR